MALARPMQFWVVHLMRYATLLRHQPVGHGANLGGVNITQRE
jgi:hypothetical protein